MTDTAATPHTSQQILDIAQGLVQTRGFNAFSYADIAVRLHVSKASLHYHFPSKAELGVSLIERYEKNIQLELARIAGLTCSAADKVRQYVQIYSQVLADARICMCGMLAAEFETLPREMQKALDHYFAANETWLVGILEDGRKAGELHFAGPAQELAQFIISSLEGTMILARSHGGIARFDSAVRRLLSEIGI